MPLTGDFARLKLVRRKLEQLASGKLLEQLNRNLAEEAIEQIRVGFETESAPDGSKWAPIKRRRQAIQGTRDSSGRLRAASGRFLRQGEGSGRILQDTGRLRGSFKVARVSRSGFRVSASTAYAPFHQSGTSRMVARPMVPEGSLPGRWKRAFTSTAEEFFESHFNV